MVPMIVILTILAGLSTGIGSMLGGGKWWGYYPAVMWGRLICWISFVKVTVTGCENIDSKDRKSVV